MSTALPTPQKPRKNQNYFQQTAQNRMLVVVLGMVVLVPLLALPTNHNAANVANFALRLMAALLAGILVFRVRFATNITQVQTFLATGANFAILLFLLDTVVSLFVASPEIRRIGAIDLMRVFTGVMLYFALAYHVRRSEHLAKIQDALVVVAVVVAGFGLVNVQSMSQPLLRNPVGDHQLFGALLMMLFPITLIAAITERDQKRRIIAGVSCAMTGVCLIFSQTRTSWVGAVGEVIALILFSLIAPRKKNRDATTAQQFLIPALIVVSCMTLFVVASGSLTVFKGRMEGDSQKSALEYRNKMWYAAGELVKQKPLFGHGLGTYPVYQHQFSGYGRSGGDVLKDTPTLGEMAHSYWLQTAAEQGIVGVCAFAAIIGTFLLTGLSALRFRDGGIRRWVLLSSLAASVGFCIDALGNPAWQFAQISMFLWLSLGLGVAALRPNKQRGSD